MPRRSSGMKSSGFSRSSGPTRTARAAPQPTHQAPLTQQSPGLIGSIGGTIMQGMAFGAGSEVAHQAVRGLMGNSSSNYAQESQSQPQPIQEPCYQQNQDFLNCLQYNKNDIGMCQSYLDLYKQCKGQF
ncbi:unnamed protein product [Blepharisma stoltei]|uniref:CHCH domain-containing protein n=1 Tax=Blepharisma stoltei TaxID=1481888 RepID=A0AAU9J9T8_9CILI|nr:unnamed protein product [Blepharisma stoltei]